MNLPRDSGCRYEAGRSCIQGLCVVGALERQIERLHSGDSDVERLKALKYVVHLVADVHQPLHAGFADDRGGNKFQVQASGRGTNLHAVWDSALVEHWPGGQLALRAAVEKHAAAGDAATAPARWAEESCATVLAQGFYPARHRLDERYAERWRPTLVEQLAKASARLAAVLNQTLSTR